MNNKQARRTRRTLLGSLAAVGLVATAVLSAAPAYADSWGYVNCYPNGAPPAYVTTMSHSSGYTTHQHRWNTSQNYVTKTYNIGVVLETHRWSAGHPVNVSTLVNAGIWLYAADRYCA